MNDSTHIKVLAIEDSPTAIFLLKQMLADAGEGMFDLQHTDRLASGITRLKSDHFDIVLLDILLPDSRGFEAYENLHAEVPDVPVLVMSGIQDELVANKMLSEGACGYLVKGDVDGEGLVRAIRAVVDSEQSEE